MGHLYFRTRMLDTSRTDSNNLKWLINKTAHHAIPLVPPILVFEEVKVGAYLAHKCIQ